jgi:hypothetical protein
MAEQASAVLTWLALVAIILKRTGISVRLEVGIIQIFIVTWNALK